MKWDAVGAPGGGLNTGSKYNDRFEAACRQPSPPSTTLCVPNDSVTRSVAG